jgi:hypothetical protein
MPPPRPNLIVFTSVCELYLQFRGVFLDGNEIQNEIISACGHIIRVFDHHFFHLVKLDDPFKPKPLKMATEKAIILGTNCGFGDYKHDKQRAIYLRSGRVCLDDPDEVWEDPTLATARWIYIKEFEAKPYRFTVLLVGERLEGLVPVTSFPAKARDAKKWRRGTKIYPKNTSAAP